VLCDLRDVSYADAAGTLKVPIGTVRSRLFRAREARASREGGCVPAPAWKRALARLTP
jgi:DNA-directed RNA polymerase specialized sigma24 family protein